MAVGPGAAVTIDQLQAPPRIDLDGEGLFCLMAVCLAGSEQQELCWCVSNVPDYEFGLGLQVASYMPPSALPPYRLVFLLYRQPGDDPMDLQVAGADAVPRKLNEAAAPTDSLPQQGGRAAFDAKQCAADNCLGHPVAVSWVEVQA
ncbi:CEN 1 [Chlorella sorokiniana]|uniref:CEN 1 n=1 Tax=Chlorella sorokiniana TaxID=3076 RepID=A0A2P6TBZ3_CHLSO|nr:CEN 1 [Chlorella sorokiniana]|eukprot:PRW18385.1 CEN 1 [Chlorella sorokiniana]